MAVSSLSSNQTSLNFPVTCDDCLIRLDSKYWIGAMLGEGRFSEAYRSEALDGTSYALKIPKAKVEGVNAKDLRGLFAQELSMLVYLKKESLCLISREAADDDLPNHHHIVILFDFCNEPEKKYMVFDRGVSLTSWIFNSQLKPMQKVQKVALHLLKALSFLSSLNVIHGDLKLDNVLVMPGDVVKLSDFGNALISDPNSPYLGDLHAPCYRSPECILKTGYYTSSADVWALACVLYEVYAGVYLFNRVPLPEIICDQESLLREPYPKELIDRGSDEGKGEYELSDKVSCSAIFYPGLEGLLPGQDLFCDLLRKMMKISPELRISPDRALEHGLVTTPIDVSRKSLKRSREHEVTRGSLESNG